MKPSDNARIRRITLECHCKLKWETPLYVVDVCSGQAVVLVMVLRFEANVCDRQRQCWIARDALNKFEIQCERRVGHRVVSMWWWCLVKQFDFGIL